MVYYISIINIYFNLIKLSDIVDEKSEIYVSDDLEIQNINKNVISTKCVEKSTEPEKKPRLKKSKRILDFQQLNENQKNNNSETPHSFCSDESSGIKKSSSSKSIVEMGENEINPVLEERNQEFISFKASEENKYDQQYLQINETPKEKLEYVMKDNLIYSESILFNRLRNIFRFIGDKISVLKNCLKYSVTPEEINGSSLQNTSDDIKSDIFDESSDENQKK